MEGVFLSAEWRHLVMLNYAVERRRLEPLVPAGTELDLWRGEAVMSMVGFRFLRTRLLGVPVPFHRDFDEVNLRFYVRRMGPEGWRRGVVFVREIVPRRAIAAVARLIYGENYVFMPMAHHLDPEDSGLIEYRWRHSGHWSALSARVRGEPDELEPGSEAEFIAEHYWGYARQRNGSTVEYRVEHPRWRAWAAEAPRLDADVDRLYGPDLGAWLKQAPRSAFVAEGSPIVVRRGRRL